MSSSPNPSDLRDIPDVIRAFAAAQTDLLPDLLLFARCLFVTGERGFKDAQPSDVEALLEPVHGLPLEGRRRRMLARLFTVVPNPAFDVPRAAAPIPLSRRGYRFEVFRRTAEKRARVTAAQAVHTERRTAPFYESLREVFGPQLPDSSHYAPVVKHVVRALTGRASPAVLDVACAGGLMLKAIGEHLAGARLVGTDILKLPGRAVALGAAQPFRDASFDAVTATGLLEHVLDLDTQVREFARLVRPDGIVVVVTITVHTLGLTRDPLSYVEGLASTVWPRILPPHHDLYEPLSPLMLPHRAYTRQDMASLFKRHFTDVRVRTLHFEHLRKFGLESRAPSLPLLRHFGGQLMVVARRPRR